MNSYFDPTAKENRAYIDYFENKSWLIVDSSTSIRTAIKKSINQLGSKISNIYDANNFDEALSIIDINKPQIFLGNKNIEGGSILSLLENHQLKIPNRLDSGFYVLTEENALSEVGIALDYEMDGIISLPFTAGTIINTLVTGAKYKVSPSLYLKVVNSAREKYIRGYLDEALQDFQNALSLDPHPAEAHYFIGRIFNGKKLIDDAISAYEKAIIHNPKHYKALKNLSVLYSQNKDYKKAYEAYVAIALSYPLSAEQFPELIRLSIINQQFPDINNYLKIFNSFQNPNIETQIYLAAGFTVLGKFFSTNNEEEKSISVLKIAFSYSNGKHEILQSICNTFYKLNKPQILLELFEKTDTSTWNEATEGFHFYTLHMASEDHRLVLNLGEKLLKKKNPNFLVYKGLIERGIQMGRKAAFLEELVAQANADFPSHKEEFELLLKTLKPRPV